MSKNLPDGQGVRGQYSEKVNSTNKGTETSSRMFLLATGNNESKLGTASKCG